MNFLFLLFCGVSADVYMHNPRGANDRNCERNVNRNNGNLLYDTQNNAKGGYACPRAVAGYKDAIPPGGMTKRMEFQVGSQLEVEWTNQHGCGLPKQAGATFQGTASAMDFPNVHCEMVIEMGCSSTFDPPGKYGSFLTGANAYKATPREGIPNGDGDAATNRINTNDATNNGQAYGTSINGARADNTRYGMHETAEWYNECNRVQRNKGLFTADQNVNRRSAIGTRQNPNGGRRGLECPEERDYYPYWRPTPFVGVAYLVDDPARCGATGTAAAKINHVANKGGCGGWIADATGAIKTSTTCQGTVNQGDWVGNAQGYVTPGKAASTAVWAGNCVVTATKAVPVTQNGLNNAARNAYRRREWPNTEAACKALGDATVSWQKSAFHGKFSELAATTQTKFKALMATGPLCSTIDQSRSNHLGNDGTNDDANRYTMTIPDVVPTGAKSESCVLRLRYNMSSSDYVRNITAAKNRDASPVKQDPLVQIGPGNADVVQLAVNTNQYGRTFQDRSYTFEVVPRAVVGQFVLNVNSRGKRGNIVQVYPAVEYDFVPNEIHLKSNPQGAKEYPSNTVLDFQWTGSDYNPRRGCNDAEGGPYVGDQNIGKRLNAGTQGTNQNSRVDRNTLCEMQDSRRNYPTPKDGVAGVVGGVKGSLFYKKGDNGELARKFAFANAKKLLTDRTLVQGAPLQCLTKTQIAAIRDENRRENHPRNCAEGNAISPYFESTPIKVADQVEGNKAATFQLYSCRNNNFSNRDTKLQIFYSPGAGAAVPPPAAAKITDVVAQTVPLAYYSTEKQIDSDAETDVPPMNLVENDGYKDGAVGGCTQDLYFGAASTVSSFNVFMALIISGFYLF